MGHLYALHSGYSPLGLVYNIVYKLWCARGYVFPFINSVRFQSLWRTVIREEGIEEAMRNAKE
jgi:hypothetical protein